MFTGAYGQKHDEDRLDLVGLDPNNQVDKDDRGPAASRTSGSEINTWGGVVQNIESAAMDLYLIYSHIDAKFDAVNTANGISTTIDDDNLDLVQAGAMIKF